MVFNIVNTSNQGFGSKGRERLWGVVAAEPIGVEVSVAFPVVEGSLIAVLCFGILATLSIIGGSIMVGLSMCYYLRGRV